MYNDNYIIYNGELYHHGVKGMKWGIRRTKAQLGYKISNFKKKRQQKKDEETRAKESAPKKKSVSDMSDDELNKAINRARLEDTYRQLRPEQVSRGKRIVNAALDKVIGPSLIDAGRKQLTNWLNKLGDDALAVEPQKSKLDKLKEEYDILDYQNKIKKAKKGPTEDTNWSNLLKKQQYEQNERQEKERLANKAKKEAAEKEAEKIKKAAIKAAEAKKEFVKEQAQKQVDEYNDNWLKGEPNTTYSKKGNNITDRFTSTSDNTPTNPNNLPAVVESGKNYALSVLSNSSRSSSTSLSTYVDKGASYTAEVLDKNGTSLVKFDDPMAGDWYD